MIKIYPYETLGHHEFGWLDARYHFSFARYHNPARMGFGALRVINDDVVQAGKGFDPHGHENMEIITYVRKGAITHRDSMNNEGRTGAGDVQVMSAGTGVQHSEYNNEDEDTNLYQIWIEPNKQGVKPGWDARAFPQDPVKDSLKLLVSGRAEDADKDALFINQDAAIYGGRLEAGQSVNQSIKYQAYLLVSEGSITIGDETMKKGDGAEITDQEKVTIAANENAEIVLIDVPATA